ncbi:MAG: DUF1549 domain-containing protein [Acidobacteria bacterium]|nr:DUF1549 domain-containing protein [Acidobacteriota bacterium]
MLLRSLLILGLAILRGLAQNVDTDFFEARIRPVLASKCYQCHSSKLKAPMGGLTLDSREGIRKGGALGPSVVPGRPGEGHLLRALSYTDHRLQMPPTGKLPAEVVADFRRWIEAGAPDPRTATQAPTAALKGMPIEQGRTWWAFVPFQKQSRPGIDEFITTKLQAKGLAPSPPEDPRTLVRRAYVDLAGFKPSYEEVESFASSTDPHAYAALIDRLLASPQYGERWARHWLDVARFGEDNPTSEATNPPYPFAWRYRDWVIEALNRDIPYDQFIKLQLAADHMPAVARGDLRALGYLGTAPIYHKDQRLSAEVIGGFMTDDWDDRVDALTRGVLGLTVACARCHDHKFDPLSTKDYYALVGVFASTMRAERPLFDVDPGLEARYMWVQRRLFDLRYSINLMTSEASTVVSSKELVAKWKPELEALEREMKEHQERHPQLVRSLEKYWTFTRAPRTAQDRRNLPPNLA